MNTSFKTLNLLSLMFVVIGGVNSGFVALLGFDPLVTILGGYNELITKAIYGLFGISSLWVFYAYLMTPGQDYGKE